MTIQRWFDLTGESARLDRKISEAGSAYLELTFADSDTMGKCLNEDRLVPVAENGWVKPEDGLSIRHYGDFRDFTDISRSLAVVFEGDVVTNTIVPRDELRQGEVLEGVDRPVYVQKEHIDHSMRFLPDAVRNRALSLIERARGRQSASHEIDAGGGELLELARSVSSKVDGKLSTHLAKLAAVRHDEGTISEIRRLVGDDSASARDSLDRTLGAINVDEARLFAIRGEAVAFGYDAESVEEITASEIVTSQPDARQLVMSLDASQAEDAPLSDGFRRDVHGYRFEVSADTTTYAAREYQARLTSTLSFVADTFGVEPSDVLPPNTRIRVVQGLANQRNLGVQHTQTRTGTDSTGEEFVDQSNAIVFSQGTIGIPLHEIVHGLSRRLGDDPSKYDEIIHGSGLAEAMNSTLSEGKLRGVGCMNDEEFTAYLRDPEETLARVVENALRSRCIEQHGSLDPLGGHAIAGHWMNYAPLDADVMDRAIRAVHSFGVSRGVMADPSDEPDQDAPDPLRSSAISRVTRGR
ncbi:hypothetical protein [uncultured Tateyamaria sp.]|uniref:hypothetical protein n=1 Tax=uncultured Tateyamaria sp. TaxID=455651 RepID=UPI00261B5133|nr:hypothetical protein [uncultured Tateyamaria sp.]